MSDMLEGFIIFTGVCTLFFLMLIGMVGVTTLDKLKNLEGKSSVMTEATIESTGKSGYIFKQDDCVLFVVNDIKTPNDFYYLCKKG